MQETLEQSKELLKTTQRFKIMNPTAPKLTG